MFKKSILATVSIVSVIFGVNTAYAGRSPEPALSLSATTTTEIFVGDSVTFSYTYGCNIPWASANLQPFDDTADRGSVVIVPVPLVPTNVAAQTTTYTETGNFSLTFTTAGTYNIDARVNATMYQNASINNEISSLGLPLPCDVANATAKVIVVVRDRPTTTTTVATTTTVKEKKVLPATGSDNSNALIAVGVALAGTAILISRRRLLTK